MVQTAVVDLCGGKLHAPYSFIFILYSKMKSFEYFLLTTIAVGISYCAITVSRLIYITLQNNAELELML